MAKVLTLWIDEVCAEPVRQALTGVDTVDGSTDKLESLMDHPLDPPPSLIICGVPNCANSLLEVAQGLSLTYPASPVFFVTSNKDGFFRADLVKNGFADAFLIPFESKECTARIGEALARAAANPMASYRTVKILDFQGSEPLDFDTYIYLPLRGKHIRYTHAGKELTGEQISRLKSHDVSSLHIKTEDMPKFYQFTAMQLMMLGKNETMSQTEKQDKLQNAVRSVVSGVFSETSASADFDSGRKLINDCQEIVKSYISASTDKQNSLYEKIAAIAQEGEGTYAQATNVATFSALFAIGLGVGTPEEVAMAGLLCDVGLAELPASVQLKDDGERSAEEERHYQQHPILSVNLLKSKRMILPENAAKMILQHHERYDGTGFPNRLTSERIIPEAQILALAVQFSELLVTKKGHKRMSPREAIEHIRLSEAGHRYSPDLLRRVHKLLFGDAPAKDAA